jgi:hypothetical protein
VAGLRAVEVAPVADFVADVGVGLVVGFADTDLRRLAAPPAADADAAAEGRNDEAEGFFAGAAPDVSVLPDPVGVFRAIVELPDGLVLAVDEDGAAGLGTGGLGVGRATALGVVEPGRGARGVPAEAEGVGFAWGLPIEPVVGLSFGAVAVGVAPAAVGSLEVEEVAVEGRVLVVVVLAREVAGFFGLAGSFLVAGVAGAVSDEVAGVSSSAV